MNDKEIEKLAKNIYKALTNTIADNQTELTQAIALLQSNGYTLTPPYIPPTDDEIIARIVSENEKVGYVADWNDESIGKYYIVYGNAYRNYTSMYSNSTVKSIGVTYTTQSIAKQIVAELNEKRLVRVD